MRFKRLLRMADIFYILAEKLPENSTNIKTILDNLTSLDNFNSRKKYAEKNLEHLSSGSSRLVYKAPDNSVIKLAKNDKGLAQNKAEANPKMKSKFINEIISHDKDYIWIQTHLLKKITVDDFKKMTGLDFHDFGDMISYGLRHVSDSSKDKPSSFDKISKSSFYKEMLRIGKKFKLMPGDLIRISSWGTKNNCPILIDAGLTKDVYDSFYESQ